MSQIHKTPFYVQHAIRSYIDSNKSFSCQMVEGLTFEEIELPLIAVVVTSQESLSAGNGPTGNKVPSVSIVLQTSYTMTEEQHWDLWSEIEDMFAAPRATVLANLNDCTSKLGFNNMEIESMINVIDDEVRKTRLDMNFLTYLKQ